MSSDDVVGLPCKQQANGCIGKMTRGKCSQGKHEGKEFLACEDREWHDNNKQFKGEFIWTNQKQAIDLYVRKAKAGFPKLPPTEVKDADGNVTNPAPAPKQEKRAYTEAVDDQSCRTLLIDINHKLETLVGVQQETLAFFEREFKRAKKSSEEDEAQDGATQQ